MFQAWLVKMAKMAANSAPKTRPGTSDMKNTTVMEMKPKIGTDCRMSRMGTNSLPARSLLAAHVAYVSVNSSDSASAANMRKVVRAAYSGKCEGFKDMGVISSALSGANKPREVSPKNTTSPMTTMNARTSQRENRSRKKTLGSKRFMRTFSQDRQRSS